MGNTNQGGSFWTTLPGVLAGCATLVAAIGGLIGALYAAGVIGSRPEEHFSPATLVSPPPGLYAQYQLDCGVPRMIMVNPIDSTHFHVGEPGGSWPWDGTITLNGDNIDGDARFLTSKAIVKLQGTRLPSGNVSINYVFIKGDDGLPTTRVDHHDWCPVK